MADAGIETLEELEAFLVRSEGCVVFGRRLTRVGVNERGETMWRFVPVN